jgi:outer membrane lipoprotein-sorting protein
MTNMYMLRSRKLIWSILLLLASTSALAADNAARVLRELDLAAVKFKNVAADFEWQTVQTTPIPDTETQSGTIYFERSGDALQMSAHIRLMNHKEVSKVLSYSNGTATLYEARTNDFRVFRAGGRQGQLESILLLGFGSSGKEILGKWEITFIRQEDLKGVKCQVLELRPRDPELKKNLRLATVWVDALRGVTLKQILDADQGTRRVCVYTNLRVNTHLPADAIVRLDAQDVRGENR